MNVEVYHLAVDSEEESVRDEAWDVSHRVRMGGEVENPTQDEFERLYEKVGEDYVDAEVPEVLHRMWERWNAGSRRESEAFVSRACCDCDEVFTGERPDGTFDLGARQAAAERHEHETRAAGDEHEVERSNRSLMVGDCLVVDGEVYACAPFGWNETSLEAGEVA